MKARVCQLFEVFQHEFANFSLPCEGRLRLSRSIQTSNKQFLTQGRFSKHQNSVVQISCCRKLIVMCVVAVNHGHEYSMKGFRMGEQYEVIKSNVDTFLT